MYLHVQMYTVLYVCFLSILWVIIMIRFAGRPYDSFTHWSHEQLFTSRDQSPYGRSTLSAVSGDGSPELPEPHMHGISKSAKATHASGRGQGVAGIGRSSSEEVMRTTQYSTKGGE